MKFMFRKKHKIEDTCLRIAEESEDLQSRLEIEIKS